MSDEQEAPTPAKPKRTRKNVKLTPAEWGEIERAWTEGRFSTMEELAEHFKQPINVLRDHMKAKKLRRGADVENYNRKVQAELEKKAQQEAKVLADRIAETREQHYNMANGIAKLTWAEILKAKQEQLPLASIKQNLASLESAMKVLKMAREERFAVLGVDREGSNLDEEDVPELVVNELTQDQIEEMRARDEAALAAEEAEDDAIVQIGDDGNLLDLDDDEDIDGA